MMSSLDRKPLGAEFLDLGVVVRTEKAQLDLMLDAVGARLGHAG